MVDDRGLLGGNDRVIERDMRGGEDAGLGGRSRNAGGPGVGLEASALRIGGAAEAVPARDRHQRLEIHLFGEPGEIERIRPGDVEPAVEIRHYAAAVEIGLESYELQFAAAEGRVGCVAVVLAGCTRGRCGL